MGLRLRLISDHNNVEEFLLEKEEIFIGREISNDVVLHGEGVSRRHARVVLNDKGDYFIEDLDSTKGIFLNDRQVKNKQIIKTGDRIRFGENSILGVFLEEYPAMIKEAELKEKTTSEIKENANQASHSGMSALEDKLSIRKNEKMDVEIHQKIFLNPFLILVKLKKLPDWASITIIAIFFLVLFCLFPLIIIEVTNQWCNLFSGFFNAIKPGICP